MTCKKIVNSCFLGGITALVYHTSGNALTFNFTYGNGVTYEQKVAAELAGKFWSNYLADPV